MRTDRTAAVYFFSTMVLCASACVSEAASIVGRVVDADGQGVADAVVFVEAPAPRVAGAKATAVMDQIDKTFVPGMLPVVVGTQVNFPNRDQIRHHVYSFSRAKRFELPLYKGEEAPPVLFDKPGVVKIGCNIHDWMSALVLVVPNEHYAVTDGEGRFQLAGLEPGAHTIAAWHERNRGKTEDSMQRVQLGPENLEIDFRLSLAPARARPATRGARWE